MIKIIKTVKIKFKKQILGSKKFQIYVRDDSSKSLFSVTGNSEKSYTPLLRYRTANTSCEYSLFAVSLASSTDQSLNTYTGLATRVSNSDNRDVSW